MAKCHRLPGGGDSGFRLWPPISFSDLRRKLLDVVTCGVSHRPRRRKKNKNAVPFPRPDRLSELLKLDISSDSGSESSSSASIVEQPEELKELVAKRLRSKWGEERKEAAAEVRRLAKDNADARETIARLGAIPPLVGMIDSDDVEIRISALYALLNIGIGNEMNKAAIVKEGAIHKMLSLIIASEDIEPRVSEAVVANFLGLSAIDSNKPIIGASPGAIQFLVNSFLSTSSGPSRQDSLRALFNLSLSPPNSHPLLQCNIVPVLLSSIGGSSDCQLSERSLAILSNLVSSSSEARRCIAKSKDALPILVDALSWLESPSCQEHSSYILMVLAHKSSAATRAAMIEAGINTPLLELALVGTALAQKRASKVFEILRMDREKQVSEGFGRSGLSSLPECGDAASEGRRAVAELVNESLRGNMRRIIRRANMPSDSFAAGAITAAAAAGAGGSSSSKSLTF